jgi:hypothetical protein
MMQMQSSAMCHFDDKLVVDEMVEYSLPCFHSCDAMRFRGILDSGVLKTHECKVFNGEKLLYLFYGRPAYKSNDNLSHQQNHSMPIVFVIRNSVDVNAKRVCPFDTGAFKNGLFEQYMHRDMKVEDFLLSPGQEGIRKTIAYFFGSNVNYFFGRAKPEIICDELDFEVQAYHSLIRSIIPQLADDRKASIEIQLDHEIQLTQETIQAVICPSHFTNSRIFKKVVIDELNAVPITYESFGLNSNAYYSEVLKLVRNYLGIP